MVTPFSLDFSQSSTISICTNYKQDKTITTNQKTLDENLHLVFRSVLTRLASNEELTLIRHFYTTTLVRLKQNPAAIVKITGSDQEKSIEQAAWVLTVRSLLNLDEALVKR